MGYAFKSASDDAAEPAVESAQAVDEGAQWTDSNAAVQEQVAETTSDESEGSWLDAVAGAETSDGPSDAPPVWAIPEDATEAALEAPAEEADAAVDEEASPEAAVDEEASPEAAVDEEASPEAAVDEEASPEAAVVDDALEGGEEASSGDFSQEKVDAAVALLTNRMQYALLDWKVTDSDVAECLAAMSALNSAELDAMLARVDPKYLGRLNENRTQEHDKKYAPVLNNVERLGRLASDPMEGTGGETTATVGGANPEDVVQNADMNDCYLAATMASVAKQRPGDIDEMVKPDGNGGYDVRIYTKNEDGETIETWVTVNAGELPTRDGSPGYTHSPQSDDEGRAEAWPAAIEAAYAKVKGGYGKIDYGLTVDASEALLGSEGDQIPLSKKNDSGKEIPLGIMEKHEAFEKIQNALQHGDAVVASDGGHATTVLEVYENSDGVKFVKYRDQLESGPESGRIHDVTWEEFQRTRRYVRATPT